MCKDCADLDKGGVHLKNYRKKNIAMRLVIIYGLKIWVVLGRFLVELELVHQGVVKRIS